MLKLVWIQLKLELEYTEKKQKNGGAWYFCYFDFSIIKNPQNHPTSRQSRCSYRATPRIVDSDFFHIILLSTNFFICFSLLLLKYCEFFFYSANSIFNVNGGFKNLNRHLILMKEHCVYNEFVGIILPGIVWSKSDASDW